MFSQPALYVAGLAAVEKLRAEEPAAVEQCSAAAGLSLGEYCALVFAGALSFEDGLKVPCCAPQHVAALTGRAGKGSRLLVEIQYLVPGGALS